MNYKNYDKFQISYPMVSHTLLSRNLFVKLRDYERGKQGMLMVEVFTTQQLLISVMN